MKNITTYTNEEVVGALMAYHKRRMNFDEKLFTMWAELRLDDKGSWTVLTEDIPPAARKRVGVWHKLMNFAMTGRWAL